ncbi:hypothetical protein J6W91_02020 [Candidatus Saccharibacteria bacterium]|nr:hypothetical protein [Candidatus Saccharibacteria bacterium]
MKKTKKYTFKENLKRLGLWVMVLAVLASTVSAAATYADEVVTVRSAMDLIEDATTKQAVAQKFARCLGSRTPNGGSAPVYSANRVSSGSVYQSGLLQTNIATGTWLENQVQGNGGDDGEIYCSQGIWSLFASTFGLSNVQIACDKFSDSGNGHLKGGLFKHTPDDVDCQDMSGFYMAVDAATAEAYIGRLYTEAVADNPYAKSWGDIVNYDSVTGYSIYKRDLQTSCISEFSEDASNAGHFDNKVKVVNEKGEMLEFYALSKSGKKGSTKVGNTIASAGEVTCDDLIAKMNAYAEDYRQAILEAKRKECASPDVVAKVAEYIAKYEEAEELTEEEQADYEAMKQARDSGDYTTPTDKGGLECTNFKYLTVHEPSPTSDPTSSPSGPTDPHAAEEEACYKHAKSLGWVICPVIYGLREMSENFYQAIVPLLQVNDSVVSQFGSNNSSLYKVWATFRNIANIIFVIMFMAVILSQLTGYGIDNYGIKRMLPKLIITAILVNISFWLCAIAVDISNILGKTIKEFLEGLAVSSSIGGDSSHAVGHIVQTVVGWIAVASTVTVGVGVAFALEGWAIIIPILLFLLVVVISIFFALIILGMRQALVVILLAISPVAIVCTLLPNTEPVFKKWLNTAKSMLMVYPIIGAVIGAGYLTASILMGADQGFIMTLVAGVLMVGPYFMIPSLTRKALDAVGGLGTRLGNLGSRAAHGARNGIAGSEAVRNFRADQNANARYRRNNSRFSRWLDDKTMQSAEANRGKKGARAWIANHTIASNGRLRAVQRNDESRVANARESVEQGAQYAHNNMNRMENGGFEARAAGIESKAIADAVSDYEKLIGSNSYSYTDANGTSHTIDSQSNSQIADALKHELEQGEGSYDANKVRALTNMLASKGKEGRDLMYKAVDGAQKNGATNKAIKDFSSNIMDNHAGTMKEKHRSLYEFAKNTADMAINDSNRYAQHSDSIQNYAAGGVSSLTAADMTNMDIQQLQRYGAMASSAIPTNPDGTPKAGAKSDQQILADLAQSALTDEHLSKDLSEKTFSTLSQIASNGGHTPPARRIDSGDVRIDHATQAGAQQIHATQSATATANAARAAQAGLEAGARARNQVITDSERASIRDAIDKAERGGGRQTDSGIWTPS